MLVGAAACGGGKVPDKSGDTSGGPGNEVLSGILPEETPACEPNTLFCDPTQPEAIMKCTVGGKPEVANSCPAGQLCSDGKCVMPEEGAEGLVPVEGQEGAEGKAEGVEGTEGFEGVEGTEGFEGHEGTEGTEGVEGQEGAEGNEGFEGVEGAETPDAGPDDAGSGDTDAEIEDAGDAGGAGDGGDSGVPIGPPDAGVDAGSDAGIDAGFDAGLDASIDGGQADAGPDAGLDGGLPLPTISSIDGDSAPEPPSGPAHGEGPPPANPIPAIHRFRQAWIVTGTGLDKVTQATLAPQGAGTTHTLSLGAKSMTQLKLGLPATLTAGGYFTLVLMTAAGAVEAQTYVLQGEKGDTGAKGDTGPAGKDAVFPLTVTGDVTFSGNAAFAKDVNITGKIDVGGMCTADGITAKTSYDLPDCPEGYTKDVAESINGATVCKRGPPTNADEMVKVGNFWIDRYEASAFSAADCQGSQYGYSADDYPAGFPDNGNFTTKVFACSRRNILPSASLTWFQAQQACVLAGKQLPTNEEWQAAAAGTYDPGTAETGTQCRIASTNTSPRNTGSAGSTPAGSNSCVSSWGAQDMIGNLWEWVAWWGEGGKTWQTSDGQSAGAWPVEYGGDFTWNVNGSAYSGTAYGQGLPAAAVRGGWAAAGGSAGVFAIDLRASPSARDVGMGFRCVKRR